LPFEPLQSGKGFRPAALRRGEPLRPSIIEAFAHCVIWRTAMRRHSELKSGFVTSAASLNPW
jgi:hypothetical protein